MKVIDRFVIKRPESKGKKCEFFKAKDTKSGKTVCIKSVNMKIFEKYPNYHSAVMNEIKFWQKYPLKNGIEFVKALKSKSNFYIIMEHADEGSLETLIKRNIFLEERKAMKIFEELVDIFRQLVNRSILHRHLKPSNVLLKGGKVKLSDFKYCISSSQKDLNETPLVGCPLYTAPEVLNGYGYQRKSDIWSLGCLLHEMLFGNPPINCRNVAGIKKAMRRYKVELDQRVQRIDGESRILLEGMLKVEPDDRFGWEEVFKLQEKISWKMKNIQILPLDESSFFSKTNEVNISTPYFDFLEKFQNSKAFVEFERLIKEVYFVNNEYTNQVENRLRRYRLKIRILVYVVENIICKKFHNFSHVYHRGLYYLISVIRIMGIKMFNYLKEIDLEDQNSSSTFIFHLKESIFEEINKFDAPYKILRANNPELPSEITPKIFFEEMQRYLNYLIEEIITNEDDEILLKTAIFQANLVLDILMMDLSVALLYRLDLKFCEQKYPDYLSKINYKSIVDLMNAKLKYFSQHSESFLPSFSID